MKVSAGAHDDGPAVAGPHQTDPLGDVQCLPTACECQLMWAPGVNRTG